jgi:hypothetical protein
MYKGRNLKLSKWRTQKTKHEYLRYDDNGRIIEKGEYGEIWHYRNVSRGTDGSMSIVSGHWRNYKKLDKVYYYEYDTAGQKTGETLWKFNNNKKDYLIHKTLYEYGSKGKLLKETEWDRDNKITRLRDYANLNESQVSKDSVFKFSYKDIVRVDGQSIDTAVYDSLGRPLNIIHYYKGKFLYRQAFIYDKWGGITTELRYDGKPDSLWSLTEWQYNIYKQPVRKFWKAVGSTTETRDVYIYNRHRLLVKVLHYHGEKLRSFSRYKYKLR